MIPDPSRRGKLKCVEWSKFVEAFPKSSPKKGVLEAMAQSATLHVPSDSGIISQRHHVAPCVLTRANAFVTL